MDRQDYNNAENAVNNAKWTVNDYADRAKDYIREQRDRNETPTAEGWMERAKDNISDAWEDTKDAVSDALKKLKIGLKTFVDNVKDAGEDVKAEWNKSTN